MIKKILIVNAVILLTHRAWAFIQPLGFVIKDAFDGRRSGSVELSMHHKIEVRPGETVDVDERVLLDHGQIKAFWTSPSFGQSVGASFSAQTYTANDKTFPTRSSLFLKSLLYASSEEFRGALIAEQFARTDQFQQYRNNAPFTGDPQTWDMKQVYLPHPDIFLARTASGASVAVVGLDDPAMQKTVYFDKRGISRLQWKERGQIIFWDFEQFSKSLDGTIPKKASFEVAGKPVVTTILQYRRVDNDRQAAEFRQNWNRAKNTAVSSNAESALRVLLSYR